MGEFIASCYEITRAGRRIADGYFSEADEIFKDCIRCQRAGVYRVDRRVTAAEESGHATAFWGQVAHFGAGRICFDPSPAMP